MGPLLILVALAFLALFIVGWVNILTKAGYSGAWVLIGFVPIVNIVMFLVFAFSDWPVRRQLRVEGRSQYHPYG